MLKVIVSLIFILSSLIYSQNNEIAKYGKILKFKSSNTSFPHKNRQGGYTYKNTHFKADEHYSNSDVMIFIPNNFAIKDSVELVFYFHGWYNNIDSSITQFNLIGQFYLSNKNAILVLPETAKNSPDSYGGKLEEMEGFSELVADINDELNDIFNNEIKIGNITLAGHSGAYRVMAFILMNGGMTNKINNVFLFDALYNDAEKFTYWLDNYNGKFINIYTQNGGTKSESENLVLCLEGWKLNHKVIDDDDFELDDLNQSRIIIIESQLEHNEVIHTKNQFQKFLESSF